MQLLSLVVMLLHVIGIDLCFVFLCICAKVDGRGSTTVTDRNENYSICDGYLVSQ